MKKLLIALTFILPVSVLAAEFHAGDVYSLKSDQRVQDDLYIASGTLNIEGDVAGDLVAGGGNLNVSGSIGKDATMAGGTVNVMGSVGDDLRVVGGEINISGNVGGDVIAAGGRVKIAEGATIGGDLIVAGGEVQNQGAVNGQVKQYVKRPEDRRSAGALGWFGLAWVVKVLMGTVLVLVLLKLWPERAKNAVHETAGNFWNSVLRGLGFLVLIPVGIIVAFVTVVGIPVGALILLLYIASIIVTSAVAALFVGWYVLKWLKWGSDINWKTVVAGVVIFELVKLVPVIGWVAMGIVFLAAFGSILNAPWRRIASKMK